MQKHAETYRLIISGGGTGGHIFPALAIAQEFRRRHESSEILFVGAQGKMEMTRVPEAGFKIVGLWISGLQRRITISNLLFPVKLIVSYIRALSLIRNFKPQVIIGTGGYASGPVMMAAGTMHKPMVIQEQNSFAGLTNRKLASNANVICVAYPKMEKYFPAEKIVLTGNPVRASIIPGSVDSAVARSQFGLNPAKKTLLVLGGSLGARTLNESVLSGFDLLQKSNIQVIWQCGRNYLDGLKLKLQGANLSGVLLVDFISDMNSAYAAADVVISRAGALAISEISIAGKPVILVPSPVVAEDHQTKNAMTLVLEDAALMVEDKLAGRMLIQQAIDLIQDEARCEKLSQQIRKMARPLATQDIVNEIEKIIQSVSK